VTGERIPHPDDLDAREAYDLLALASGPWTEGRLRIAPPKVVAAKHWLTYVELLMDSATLDIESITEGLDDQKADHKVASMRNPKAAEQARDRLFVSRLNRAKARVAKAKVQRAEVRRSLLLDEE
jgi:hypothetical protein